MANKIVTKKKKAKSKKCTKCNTVILAGWAFCPSCGSMAGPPPRGPMNGTAPMPGGGGGPGGGSGPGPGGPCGSH